jgi:hypothetical protein
MPEIFRAQWRAQATTESQPVTGTAILDNQVRQPILLRWKIAIVAAKQHRRTEKQSAREYADSQSSLLIYQPDPVQFLLPPSVTSILTASLSLILDIG